MTQENIDEIKAEALKEFELLSKIYRPSFQTRKICDYLKNRVKELNPNIEVFEDEYRANLIDDSNLAENSSGNIWFDIPANDPLLEKNQPIILQAHMDMVISFKSAEAQKSIETNGVELEYHNNGTLTSRGQQTTLGADDGIGIGFMLAILKSQTYKHGRIRCIITTDEEVGMCGITYLGLKVTGEKGGPVLNHNYLINIDTLTDGEIATSTLGAVITQFSYPTDVDAKPLESVNNIYTLRVTGLNGGHDGLDIEKHASAVWLVAEMIKDLAVIPDFRLIEFLSPDCEFQNVIQKHAFATFSCSKPFDDIEDNINVILNMFKRDYPEETGVKVTLEPANLPENAEIKPYSHEVSLSIVKLLNKLPHGIVSWKDKASGWLESCGNMGPIYLKHDESEKDGKLVWDNPSFMMKAHFRSCNNEEIEKSVERNKALAKECLGNDDLDYFQLKMIMYGWGGDEDPAFLNIAKKAFEERGVKWYTCNRRCGLEVSWFKFFNKDISMISIGPECHDLHECNETLYTETLDNAIAVILTCIDKMRVIQHKTPSSEKNV